MIKCCTFFKDCVVWSGIKWRKNVIAEDTSSGMFLLYVLHDVKKNESCVSGPSYLVGLCFLIPKMVKNHLDWTRVSKVRVFFCLTV